MGRCCRGGDREDTRPLWKPAGTAAVCWCRCAIEAFVRGWFCCRCCFRCCCWAVFRCCVVIDCGWCDIQPDACGSCITAGSIGGMRPLLYARSGEDAGACAAAPACGELAGELADGSGFRWCAAAGRHLAATPGLGMWSLPRVLSMLRVKPAGSSSSSSSSDELLRTMTSGADPAAVPASCAAAGWRFTVSTEAVLAALTAAGCGDAAVAAS